MTSRKIKKIVTGSKTTDGAGVHLVRVISHADVRDFDPFLMLDAFDSDNPDDYIRGFPWHPHRGIETVTYLVSGDIEHGDSLGNKGSILDGGCQWMTAGSGIIHQEMPKASLRMLGLQLWLNLPSKDKMTEPKYRELTQANIPVVEKQGARISVIAGSFEKTPGAMQADYVAATMLSIVLEPGSPFSLPTEESDTVFIYIMEGAIAFGPENNSQIVDQRHAVLFENGTEVSFSASKNNEKADFQGARCVLFSGKKLKEPVAWGGPIVMNTQEELDLAFKELDDGTFIKHGQAKK